MTAPHRRRAEPTRDRRELPAPGRADIGVIAADAATADEVLAHLKARFPLVKDESYLAGPSGADRIAHLCDGQCRGRGSGPCERIPPARAEARRRRGARLIGSSNRVPAAASPHLARAVYRGPPVIGPRCSAAARFVLLATP